MHQLPGESLTRLEGVRSDPRFAPWVTPLCCSGWLHSLCLVALPRGAVPRTPDHLLEKKIICGQLTAPLTVALFVCAAGRPQSRHMQAVSLLLQAGASGKQSGGPVGRNG